MKGITGETEIPSSCLIPRAVTAVPAVLQPCQQVSDTASTSATKKKEGCQLEISGKEFCCIYNKT